MNRKEITLLISGMVLLGLFWMYEKLNIEKRLGTPEVGTKEQLIMPMPASKAAEIKTATEAAKPVVMTFEEMNKLYGPCVSVPIIMYHHIDDLTKAKSEGHASLTVDTQIFRKQMEYLKSKNYNFITTKDLIAFFDQGTKLPAKPVMVTFDDGYSDIGSDAYPIMRDLGVKGVSFIPTGLMENPNYLTWSKITEMAGSGVMEMANHTWSHRNVGARFDVVDKEIRTADTQLSDHGVNNPKTFAYPYGLESKNATKILNDLGYKLAFTTMPGRTQCKAKRFDLVRIRVGNSQLGAYGF